jgi:hypothetical protein
MKRTLPVLALGFWLAAATVSPARAQSTLPQGSADQLCDQPAGGAESGDAEGHAVMATIQKVDRQRGVLEVTTKEGRAVVATTPAETKRHQEGEQLLVCLEGDAIEGERRLAVLVH